VIFVGDVAHPFGQPPSWRAMEFPWDTQPVVVNLEGPIIQDPAGSLLKKRCVFSDASILDALRSVNVKVAALGNNHVDDVRGGLAATQVLLEKHGIQGIGAGKNLVEAQRPAFLAAEGYELVLLSAGWEAIQCAAATKRRAGINPLRYAGLLRAIDYWRRVMPNALVIPILHWNYEMEAYPQPADRSFAYAAIDAGANAVIGHHPHRVGSIEIYKGAVIAYSLGNWWFPQGVYFGGRLSFGDVTTCQLALEWHAESAPVCHWFKYTRDSHELAYTRSESLEHPDVIQRLTPFAQMGHREYVRWFRANRIKRKGLPIYKNYRTRRLNRLKDKIVRMRNQVVCVIAYTRVGEFFRQCPL